MISDKAFAKGLDFARKYDKRLQPGRSLEQSSKVSQIYQSDLSIYGGVVVSAHDSITGKRMEYQAPRLV